LGYLIFSYFEVVQFVWRLYETGLGAVSSRVGRGVRAGGCALAGCGGFSGFNLPFFLGFTSGEDPVIRWLFWALALYFMGGGWLFYRINQSYESPLVS